MIRPADQLPWLLADPCFEAQLSRNSRLGEKVENGCFAQEIALLSAQRHIENRTRSRRGSYGRVLYNRFRYYDPSIGRYISADPIGQIASGDPNLYAYVWNDPLNYIDPSGLMRLPGDPSGLGPEWSPDPSHKDPNGQRFRDPSGKSLDFHKGRPDKPGWRGKDHWHYDEGDEHLVPGDEIPDPAPAPDPSGDPSKLDFFCAKNPNVCAAAAATAATAAAAARAAAAVCGGLLFN